MAKTKTIPLEQKLKSKKEQSADCREPKKTIESMSAKKGRSVSM